MRTNPEEKLNAIIDLAIEKNGGTEDSGPYQWVIDALRNCALMLYYPKDCDSGWENKEVVCYTFYCDEKGYCDTLESRRSFVIELCLELLEPKYVLSRDEDGYPTIEISYKRDGVKKIARPPKYTFEDCRQKLLENLEEAECFIFAAVAWFTNKEILDVLKRKASEGVQIIILVDKGQVGGEKRNFNFVINNGPFPFPVYPCENINVNYHNLMHYKFCIIDGKKVVHGTYNWTTKADFNDEMIAVDDNEETVHEFMRQFAELTRKYGCQKGIDYKAGQFW